MKLQYDAGKGCLTTEREDAFEPKSPEMLDYLANWKDEQTGVHRYSEATREFAHFWAQLLQPRIEAGRGTDAGSPHEVVAANAEQTLRFTRARFHQGDVELELVVEYLHFGWRYGDALLSWYNKQTTSARTASTFSDAPRPALPRRPRAA